ncbi:MAG: mobile mystery protein B [Clostridia bacterium]|nr:mobile mystery protein B [Deltaproteobacteria bacterium]
MSFEWPVGATPLTTDELQGLIPKWVTTRGELDTVENANILKAHTWLLKRRRIPNVLDDAVLLSLHRMMFRDVWEWAGEVRRSDKNIGVPFSSVRVALRELLTDAGTWIQFQAFAWDEIGARFHHRLVKIHCFANGNGRHARAATDLLLARSEQLPFTWGNRESGQEPAAEFARRERYIAALRAADDERYAPLLTFVRS